MPTDSVADKNIGESKQGYRRILLKLSGEALAGSEGDSKFGIDARTLNNVCKEIADVVKSGTQVAIVVGGHLHFNVADRKIRPLELITNSRKMLQDGMF